MKLAFPVGTLDMNNLTKIPQNGVFVEMVADGVKVKPFDSMAPVEIVGKTRLQMNDSEITLAADGGQIKTDQGNVEVANAAVVVTPGANKGEQHVAQSGDVSSKIPALSAILKQVQPDPLKG